MVDFQESTSTDSVCPGGSVFFNCQHEMTNFYGRIGVSLHVCVVKSLKEAMNKNNQTETSSCRSHRLHHSSR